MREDTRMSHPLDSEIVAPLSLSREALRHLYEFITSFPRCDDDPLLVDVAAEIAEVLDPAAPTIPVISVHPEAFDAADLERFTDATQRVRHVYDDLLDEVSEKLDEHPAAEIGLQEMLAVLNAAREAASDPYMFMIDVHAARTRG